MRAKLAVALASGAALAYAAFSLQRAQWLTGSEPVAAALGVATLAVTAISVGLILREIAFGLAMSRMGKSAEPLPELPRTASGRYELQAATAEYESARAAVEIRPEDWQAWYRLALAYDAARDRKQARAAMRHAAWLFRQLP